MQASHSFSLFVCAFGLAMVAWHVVSWAATRRSACGGKELALARRQYARRLQTSTLIFLLGVAIRVGDLIPQGLTELGYWSAVLLVVLWIGVLALLDVLAIQSHFQEQQAAQLRQRYRIEQEARRLEVHNQDGHCGHPGEPGSAAT